MDFKSFCRVKEEKKKDKIDQFAIIDEADTQVNENLIQIEKVPFAQF